MELSDGAVDSGTLTAVSRRNGTLEVTSGAKCRCTQPSQWDGTTAGSHLHNEFTECDEADVWAWFWICAEQHDWTVHYRSFLTYVNNVMQLCFCTSLLHYLIYTHQGCKLLFPCQQRRRLQLLGYGISVVRCGLATLTGKKRPDACWKQFSMRIH